MKSKCFFLCFFLCVCLFGTTHVQSANWSSISTSNICTVNIVHWSTLKFTGQTNPHSRPEQLAFWLIWQWFTIIIIVVVVVSGTFVKIMQIVQIVIQGLSLSSLVPLDFVLPVGSSRRWSTSWRSARETCHRRTFTSSPRATSSSSCWTSCSRSTLAGTPLPKHCGPQWGTFGSGDWSWCRCMECFGDTF